MDLALCNNFSGVGSDRIAIPPTKKVMIAISGLIIFFLMRLVRMGIVSMSLFAVFLGLLVFVMLFWN